jgi:hypothetical protein
MAKVSAHRTHRDASRPGDVAGEGGEDPGPRRPPVFVRGDLGHAAGLLECQGGHGDVELRPLTGAGWRRSSAAPMSSRVTRVARRPAIPGSLSYVNTGGLPLTRAAWAQCRIGKTLTAGRLSSLE